MKKIIKRIGIVLLVIVLAVVVLLVALFIKNYIDSQKPYYADDYYTAFKSDSVMEKKYSGLGEYEVSDENIKSDNKTIKEYRIWYPTELNSKNEKYPLIMVVNASNTAALNYEPFFKRLASWGFIVAGNQDRQTGTGKTTSETLDYVLSLGKNADSVFFNKIDEDNIGIIGYSQGGAGAIRAATEFSNSNKYKTIFTGSAAYPLLAKNMGWGYDAAKIKIPYFMTAGTGTSDDNGKSIDNPEELAGICPLESLKFCYNNMSADTVKLRARATGAEHEEMLERTDGYMTAWMLYWLRGDEEAGKAFFGENADILTNSNWQDIEKNK